MREGRREYKETKEMVLFAEGFGPILRRVGGSWTAKKCPAERGRVENGHGIGRFHTHKQALLYGSARRGR
jgi:hypothetical protein